MDKVCRDCGETKPLAEYFASPRNAGGYSPTCKPCYAARQARYKMRPKKEDAPDGMKRCWRCKNAKPPADFPRNRGFHDGLDRTCRACVAERNAKYSRENREHLAAAALRRYHADPLRYADYELKKTYGLEPGAYDRILAAQDGKCGICGTDDPGSRTRRRTRRFAVDHCHDTGAVRGLLCSNCNRGIGYLKHSKDALLAAVKYLTSAESTSA